jgi:hypothetical protein
MSAANSTTLAEYVHELLGNFSIPLIPPREWMRYCDGCDGEYCFVAERECAMGLAGRCTNCGAERITRHTHTVSEAG